MAANFRMAQGQFQYPGLARSLASYCADGLVFLSLQFPTLSFSSFADLSRHNRSKFAAAAGLRWQRILPNGSP
jgi:hypothetical protein